MTTCFINSKEKQEFVYLIDGGCQLYVYVFIGIRNALLSKQDS